MRYLLFGLALVGVALCLHRSKRQAYHLPDGAELIVGSIKTTFSCNGLGYGYYADQDNNCQIFHVCHPITHADGSQEVKHFSFFCGNQTVFDQGYLVCNSFEDAIPCGQAKNFYYVNDRIGQEDALFLTDDDVARINQAKGKAKR